MDKIMDIDISNTTDSSNLTLTWVGNNESLNQVTKYFNLNVISLSNLSDGDDMQIISQVKLFDLYEMYKTKEKEQLGMYKFVAYILGSLIILSNLIVVISSGLILKKGQQPKSTYLLLGNVSLADTIVGISIIFGAIVDHDHSANSNPLCIFQIGMLVCPAMVSIFSVGLIAVDRYIYILHGLYYQRWFNTTKVRIGILCIWMIAIFISSLPAMGWTGKTFRDYRCWYISLFPSWLLIIVSVLVLSIIIMVCILYILILHSAVKTVDKIREYRESNKIAYINRAYEEANEDSNTISKTKVTITISKDMMTLHESEGAIEMRERNRVEEQQCGDKFERKRKISKIQTYYGQAKVLNSHPSKLKAVKTVLIVILCFLGTWAPYYVTVIIYVRCDILVNGYECLPLEVLTLGPLFMLGVCNSLLDPLIYAWRHSGFKKTLRKMYFKYIRKLNAESLR